MRTRNGGPIVLLTAILATACASAERRATDAVNAADAAILEIEPEASSVAPDLLEALRDTLGMARERLAAGAYDEAMALADSLPAHAAALAGRLPELRIQIQTTWDSLLVAMPRNLEALRARTQEIARTRRYPPGLDAGRLREIRAVHDSALQAWEDIKAQWEGGEQVQALDRGFALKGTVSEAMVAVGLVADDRAWGNARPIGG